MFRTGIVQYFNLHQAHQEIEWEIAEAEPEKAAMLRKYLSQLERLYEVLSSLPQPLDRSVLERLL